MRDRFDIQNPLNLKRGDKVSFSGSENFRALEETYVWGTIEHLITTIVIQHPDGKPVSYFKENNGFDDGFENIHSSLLQEGLKYIVALPETLRLLEAKK